jgi:phage shock protein C
MKDPDVTSVEQLDALLAEGTISEKDYEALRSAMEQKESEETRTDAAPMRPKLRRSMKNRQLGGVCAGIGEHLGVDPNLVRLIAVLLLLLSGGAVILVYIVFLFALPVAKEKRETGARTEGARGGFPWLFTATVLFLWMVHLAYSVYILPRFARYWDEAS